MVESLCAITIEVRHIMTSWSHSWMYFSDSESREDVASSKTRIDLFASMARAKATRCLSPPESFTHLSPTIVSYL